MDLAWAHKAPAASCEGVALQNLNVHEPEKTFAVVVISLYLNSDSEDQWTILFQVNLLFAWSA